jgi:hypothetical protein
LSSFFHSPSSLRRLSFLLLFFFSFAPFVRLKSFRRWMSETCLPCPPTKLDNNEPYVFSFYEDIVQVNDFACFPFPSRFCAMSCVRLLSLSGKYRKISFTLISSIWKNVYHCLIHAYLFFLDVQKRIEGCTNLLPPQPQLNSTSVVFARLPVILLLSRDINKAIDFVLFQEITLVFLSEKKLNEIKMKFCCALAPKTNTKISKLEGGRG